MTSKDLKAGGSSFRKAKNKTAGAKTKPPSSEQEGARSKSGQFVKGRSGNPGGRPKAVEDVRKLAQEQTRKAIERLAELMDDPCGRTAVAACIAILDRGWGKATQPLSNDPEHPLTPVLNISYGSSSRD
jgi:hypothetical protein